MRDPTHRVDFSSNDASHDRQAWAGGQSSA